MTGFIYKIENKINGKVYIGQTVQSDPLRRWHGHLSGLRRNLHDNAFLQNAWNKYGEDNFSFVVVAECDGDDIDQIEVHMIAQYRERKACYNLEGGGGNHKTLHETTRKKIGEATKLYWQNGAYENGHGLLKPVICIDTGTVYASSAQAARELDLPYCNISQVCLGKNKSVQGNDGHYYQFAYYEEGKQYILKTLRGITAPKKVVCVNTGAVYLSATEAERQTGVQQAHISSSCNGRRRFAGKMPNGDYMKWVFESDYDPRAEYSFEKKWSKARREKMMESRRRRLDSKAPAKPRKKKAPKAPDPLQEQRRAKREEADRARRQATDAVVALRNQGLGYMTIAAHIDLKKDQVRLICQQNGLAGERGTRTGMKARRA